MAFWKFKISYICSQNHKVMKSQAGKDKLSNIIQLVEKKGLEAKNLIQELKELREIAKTENDPLVVKILRYCFEYLEQNESFDVQGQFEEDEEGNVSPIEVTSDQDNLLYVLSLLQHPEQRINREELCDYRDALKNSLY